MTNIIFSDVDGCLIGKGLTCFNKITEAINRISESVLLILATGKTAHEIIHLNQYLQLPGPFIVENGQGLLFKWPIPTLFHSFKWISLGDYALLSLGEKHQNLSVIKSISPPNALLTEMEDDYLAFLTGISVEEAYLAKQRFFTQPIFIKCLSENALKILKKQLRNKNFFYSQSSNFLHATQCFSSKGRAIGFLLQSLFLKEVNRTYAIGDSLNDFSMFARCEKSYYISNHPYDALPKQCEIVLEKELSGWLKIVSEIIYKSSS